MSYIGQAPGLGQRTAFRFVAVAGQTAFSGVDAQGYPLGYTPGLVDIYLNGRLLSEPDVTAADGSTIKIATNLSAGDEVRVLAQAPFSPANTYTMAQADSFQRRRNRIVDPGMQVSQENGDNLLTTVNSVPAYAADGILLFRSTAAGGATVQRLAQPTPGGSQFRLRTTVTSVNASPVAADQYAFIARIEGADVADLRFGSASARPIGIRFGCRASVAGTYAVSLMNGSYNRAYNATVTISPGEVGQDVVKSFTLPGDVAGTWATDSSIGLLLYIILCPGSSGPSTGWQAFSAVAQSGSVNLMATNGATFDLFDVGLYDVSGLAPGVIPPFELESFDRVLAKCQRYYAKTYRLAVLPGTPNNDDCLAHALDGPQNYPNVVFEFPVTMRTTPTMTAYSTATGASGKAWLLVASKDVPIGFNFTGVKRSTLLVANTAVAVSDTIMVQATASARL